MFGGARSVLVLPALGSCKEPLNAQAVGNMLYGMQGMSSDAERCVQCWVCFLHCSCRGAAEGSGGQYAVR
jgi:hypothetical protein